MDFNEAGDDVVSVASAGPYANHLCLAPGRQPYQHLVTQFYTGRVLFLTALYPPAPLYLRTSRRYTNPILLLLFYY